jgi:hypothetical protein
VGGAWLASNSFGQDQQDPPPSQSSTPPAKTLTVAQGEPGKSPAGAPEVETPAGKPKEEGSKPKEKAGKPKEEGGKAKEESGKPKGKSDKGPAKSGKSGVKGKAISLSEAITLAEKAGKGEALRAEKQGRGARTRFTVTLLGAEGVRIRVRLDATGTILDSQELPKGGRTPERRSEREHE